MNTRTILLLAVLAFLYFLWKRKAAGNIDAAGEWNEYVPGTFRVVAGGKSIVGVDDK